MAEPVFCGYDRVYCDGFIAVDLKRVDIDVFSLNRPIQGQT
jgi:hypothetical protein